MFSATTVGGPFTVTATNSGVNGTAQVTVTSAAPAAPSNLGATITGGNTAVLTWTEAASGTDFSTGTGTVASYETLTGTVGFGGSSNQTRIGFNNSVKLLLDGYHDNGLRFFDTADSYGSQPNVGAAIKQIPRDKIVIMTKSDNRSPVGLRRDLDRIRRELGVEMIDIVLIHCVTEGDWTTRYRGAMDVLSEAREKGIIRAHGCSCHTIQALRAAAASPWVEVDLVRLNPIGSHMDADPDTVIKELKKMRADGKGIVGMKILGQGDLRDRPAEAIRYALSTGVLDAFTIGAESRKEQDNLTQRIAAA